MFDCDDQSSSESELQAVNQETAVVFVSVRVDELFWLRSTFLSGGQHCGSVASAADKAAALSTQQAYLANQKLLWTATLDIFVAMNGFYGQYVMWPLKEHLENVQSGKQKSFGLNQRPQPDPLFVHIGVSWCSLAVPQSAGIVADHSGSHPNCSDVLPPGDEMKSVRSLASVKETKQDREMTMSYVLPLIISSSSFFSLQFSSWASVWIRSSKSKGASTCFPHVWPQNDRNAWSTGGEGHKVHCR